MNTPAIKKLLARLSDQKSHAAGVLAEHLGSDQKTVEEAIKQLRELGVGISTQAGSEFKLTESIELLDEASILGGIGSQARQWLAHLQTELSLDSTSSALQRLPMAQQHGVAIMAEHQTAGRGRRGRKWVSPFARNIYLSLGWRFDSKIAELGCLPLVVALAVARALTAAGLSGHRVKWPNDLLLDGKKLAGCLVDIQSDNKGPCHAIIGVGINVHMPESELTGQIDQAWTDLESALPGLSRNHFASLLLQSLLNDLNVFSEQGFDPFREYWRQMDGLSGQAISVYSRNASMLGTAVGIDENGALLLDTGKETLRLHSGEVSLHKTSL